MWVQVYTYHRAYLNTWIPCPRAARNGSPRPLWLFSRFLYAWSIKSLPVRTSTLVYLIQEEQRAYKITNDQLSLRAFPPSFHIEKTTNGWERRQPIVNEGRKEGKRKKDDEHGSRRQLFPFDIYIYIYIYQGSEAWSPWKICPRWWGPAAASWCSDTWCMESSRFSVRGNCCCPPANWSATSPSDRSPHRRISRNTTSTVAPSIEPSSSSTPARAVQFNMEYARLVFRS